MRRTDRLARRPDAADPARRSACKHLLLIAAGLVMIYPLLWMLVSSLRPTDEIFRDPGLVAQRPATLRELHRGLERARHARSASYIINSAIVVLGASSATCSPARWPPTRSPGCSSGAEAVVRDHARHDHAAASTCVIVPQYILFSQARLGQHVPAADPAEVPGHRRVLRLPDGAVHPRHPARARRGGAGSTAAATGGSS